MNSHIPVEQRFRAGAIDQAGERKPAPVRTISSETLFGGRTEVAIDHQGSIYRLKITRQGKLILNK